MDTFHGGTPTAGSPAAPHRMSQATVHSVMLPKSSSDPVLVQPPTPPTPRTTSYLSPTTPTATALNHRAPSSPLYLAVKQSELTWQDKVFFQRLILRLAKAMFLFGAPSYRVELRVRSVAKAFRVPVEIVCQASYILISFGEYGLSCPTTGDGAIGSPAPGQFLQNTFFLKVDQSFHMGKLQDVDYLATQIALIAAMGGIGPVSPTKLKSVQVQDPSTDDAVQFEQANIMVDEGPSKFAFTRMLSSSWRRKLVYWKKVYFQRPDFLESDMETATVEQFVNALDEILARPSTVSDAVRIFCSALQAGIVAILLFYGTWLDGLCSFILGGAVGACMLFFERQGVYSVEVLLAFLVSIMSHILMRGLIHSDEYCLGVITLSPLIPLYPGITITLSMLELASRNMSSGSVRMFYSFIRSLQIGFGLSLGARLIKYVTGDAMQTKCESIGRDFSGWYVLLIIPFSAVVCVQLKGYLRQWPMMLLTSTVGFTAYHFSQLVFSRDISNVISSFGIGLLANTVARRYNDIALASVLSAVMLMAPGTIGVVGFFELLRADGDSSGTSFAVDMCIRAMSLALGLYMSTLVYFPMKNVNRRKSMAVMSL